MKFKDTLKKAIAVAKAQFKKPMVKAIGLLAAFLAMPQLAHAAAAGTDLFASQQSVVSATFGQGSSVEKWFYIGEVFMGLFGYMKTRSPLVFVGIAMVIIFTRVAFAIIG